MLLEKIAAQSAPTTLDELIEFNSKSISNQALAEVLLMPDRQIVDIERAEAARQQKEAQGRQRTSGTVQQA